MEDARGNESERRHAGRVPAGEGALGLGPPVPRARRTRPVNDQPREPQREPTRERRLRDRRAATTLLLSQMARDEKRDGDVRAWQPEDLEGPERQLEAAIVVTRRPVVERAIELRRLVDGGNEAEDEERGRGRA